MAVMSKNPTEEHLALGKFLWNRISAASDEASLEALYTFTEHLIADFHDNPHGGFMFELNLWVEFKRDDDPKWYDYGEDVKRDYPEYFKT